MCSVRNMQSLPIRERTAAHGHSLPFPYGERIGDSYEKRLFLILSVSIMLFAGCGNRDILTDMGTEKTETAGGTKDTDMTGDEEISAADQTENGETKRGQTEKEMPKETEPEEEDKEAAETPEPKFVSEPEQKEETEPAQGSTDVPKQEEAKQEETKPEETEPECEAKPEETKTEETKQQEQTVTALPYNPVSVCSQAVAKCQAGGMITTTDNFANLLSEGKITQEEYNSYYPYDGLGYYSVFVETDLNKASTTSGRKLGSEDGIADYIAGMMLLETEPVFYIEYTGVCSLNGTEFYEFRCYR